MRMASVWFVGIVVLFLSGCGGDDGSDKRGDRPLVGLVFDVGGLGDKSFNDSAHRGLLAARDSFDVAIDTLEPQDGSDREGLLRMLARGRTMLVFGVGFLFTDDITRIAEEFPDKHFACIDYSVSAGDDVPTNLKAIRFREEEGAFLVGAIAALTSRTHEIGFVGGMDIPLIHRFEAGYKAGAEHAYPGTIVRVGYAGVTGEAFNNPSKGKELALAQYDAGADIIFHAAGATGTGVFQAARQQNKLAIGVDSDQSDEAPGRVLTSMVKRVDTAVFDTIQEALNGTFTGGVVELGLADGGVDYVYGTVNAPLIGDETRARVEALREEVIQGRIAVPRER